MSRNDAPSRRQVIATGAAAMSTAALAAAAPAHADEKSPVIAPPAGKKILLSVKLGMIAKKVGGKDLTLTERLALAKKAGFDGVDFDEAGSFTPEQARAAVRESGMFVHNAINHDHWSKRLTSAKAEERAKGLANLEHCLRVSHAAGGSGVLLVVGHGDDGDEQTVADRARAEMKKALPLAASLGQMILVENVWNKMFYNHDAPPEQTADKFIKFVDSFNSRWVGMYFDIGNHWKYGNPGDWIRAFGAQCVKCDVKGFSRKDDKFVEITDGDLPWADVRKAFEDIGFTGWTTAEVGGGDLARLTTVREQMQKVFAL
jgi:L-ribulose-5-phosphate 3-epimerase